MILNVLVNPEERLRFLKFSVVGAIGAAVDFGVMNALSYWLHFPLVLAGTLSFFCAVTSNFIWNRYWTYPDSRSRPIWQQWMMFFLVNLVGVGIRIPLLHFLESPLEHLMTRLSTASFSPSLIAKNLTLAIAIGVVMLWNFFVNRYWTYNDV
ncbi:MAG: GtrA family protein [Anaerolineales bacterium]